MGTPTTPDKPAMTPRERFMCAVAHGQPDRVPCFDFLFSPVLFQEFLGRKVTDLAAHDAVDCARAMGLDGLWMGHGSASGSQPRHLTEDIYVDEWGTTYQKDAASWPIDAPIDYPVKSKDDLKSYHPPDPTAPGRMDDIARALVEARGELILPRKDNEMAIVGGVTGPLTTAWMILGPEVLLPGFYDDPDLVKAALRIATEYAIEAAKRIVATGVDAVGIADDFGHSSGPFLRLDLYREFVKPNFDEIVATITGLGKRVLLHSCGCVNLYLDEIVEAGVSALHPMQRTAGMSLADVKQRYGDRLCLIGNIDSSRTLPFGTEEDVEREVIEAIRVAGPGGGYILASDHSLHDGIPMRNVRRMFDAGRRYGVYPLAI